MKVPTIVMFFLAGAVIGSGCVSVGSGSLLKPTEGFQPKQTYQTSADALWQAIRTTLERERINIASSDKAEGRLTTDYVQGSTQVGIVGGALTTRYKYNLSLQKISDATTKLTVICMLESSSEDFPWHDISKDNEEKVANLENWLYERVEKSL